MQFITLDQRIAVENFEVGMIYTVTFSNADNFTGACIGIGVDFVVFQRTAPEYIFCLTMTTAADVASIEPLPADIGQILEYTGTVPISIKTDGTPLIGLLISGNEEHSGTPTSDNPIMPEGTGDKTANLLNADTYYSGYKSGSSYTATVSQFNNTIIRPFAMSDIGKTYTISCDITEISSTNVRWIATINGVSVNGDGRSNTGQIKLTFTVETENDSLRITYGSGNYTLTIAKVMMNEGSTALPYEPFGVKIPILSGDTTTNIYLDNPLRKSLDGTAVDELSSNGKLTQRVDTDGSVLSTPIISYIDIPTIPTTDGLNIFDIDTTLKPSEVYLKYFSPLF